MSESLRRGLLAVLALTVALATPGALAADESATACAALAAPASAVRFGQIIDAPTTVESARVLPAGTSHDPGTPYTLYGRRPLAPGSFDRARPAYAYPEVARYRGNGDPALPASWRPAAR